MTASRWLQVTDMSADNHQSLTADDFCLYMMTRPSHVAGIGRYDNEAISKIDNFKKKLENKDSDRGWHYKAKAIRDFTTDLQGLLEPSNIVTKENQYVVVPIPTSKKWTDQYYDNRLEQVAQEAVGGMACFRYANCFESSGALSSSSGGGTRDVDTIRRSLIVHDLSKLSGCNVVFLLDDVLTTGAHFKACQQIIKEAYPLIDVYGIFWARTESWI